MNNSPGKEEPVSVTVWLSVIGCAIASFTSIMDVNMVNAAIREIQASLGTTFEETSWLAAAYLCTNSIAVPLTAWLMTTFTPRRLILTSLTLFTLICSAYLFVDSLGAMMTVRAVQGFIAGIIAPFSSAVVFTMLPLSKRATGLFLISGSISLAPVLGPSIGGFITSVFGCRYAFAVEMLPAAASLLLLYFFFDNHQLGRAMDRINVIGLGCLAFGLGSVAYILQEGIRLNWLEDESIRRAVVIICVCVPGYIISELRSKSPLLNLRLLLRQNFLFSTLASCLLTSVSIGYSYLVPRYLVQVLDYEAPQVASIQLWTGVPQILLLPFMPAVLRIFPRRRLIFVGLLLTLVGCVTSTNLTRLTPENHFIFGNVVRGLGQLLTIVPLADLAFRGIETLNVGSASSLFHSARLIGTTATICLLRVIMESRALFHFDFISSDFTLSRVQLHDQIQSAYDSTIGLEAPQPLLGAFRNMRADALVIAYGDAFASLVILVTIGAIFLACTFPIKWPWSWRTPSQ